jgi:hypothetical protein
VNISTLRPSGFAFSTLQPSASACQHAPAFGFRFQHASAFKASLVSISAFLFALREADKPSGGAGRRADKARSAVLRALEEGVLKCAVSRRHAFWKPL